MPTPIYDVSYIQLTDQTRTKPVGGSGSQI